MLFDKITSTQLARVSTSTNLFNATLDGTADFSAAFVIGLLGPDAQISATNLGSTSILQSSSLDGTSVLRRIKAGTDIAVSETSTTISVDAAATITRGSTSFSGVTSSAAVIGTLNASSGLSVTGDAEIASSSITGLPDFVPTLWNPTTNGDLMTFSNAGAALTHPASVSGGTKYLTKNSASPTGLSWTTQTPQNITSFITPTGINQVLYSDGSSFRSLAVPTVSASATDPTRTKYYLGYTNQLTYVDPIDDAQAGPNATGSISNYDQDVACRTFTVGGSAFGTVTTRRDVVLAPTNSDDSSDIVITGSGGISCTTSALEWAYADGKATLTTQTDSGSGPVGVPQRTFQPYAITIPRGTTPNLPTVTIQLLSTGEYLGHRFGVIDIKVNEVDWDPALVESSSTSQNGITAAATVQRSGTAPTSTLLTTFTISSPGKIRSLWPFWSVVPTWPAYNSAMGMVRQGGQPIPAVVRMGRSGTETDPILMIQLVYFLTDDATLGANPFVTFEMTTSRPV
jgi:hypothetical protein